MPTQRFSKRSSHTAQTEGSPSPPTPGTLMWVTARGRTVQPVEASGGADPQHTGPILDEGQHAVILEGALVLRDAPSGG